MTFDAEKQRGRHAEHPWQIPWVGWQDVLWRVWNEISRDNILDTAASVAFYGLLALYPALIATVSMYGLLADPIDVVQQVNSLTIALPATARSVVLTQLTSIARGSGPGLTLGFSFSLAFAVFSASSGVAAMMRGINAAYDEQETRGWLRQRLVALFFTLGLSLFVVIAVALITLLPPVLAQLGLASSARGLIQLLRWPALAFATMAGLALLYRYGPNRTPARWQWVMPGAILATMIWTAASFSFSVYAENFGRFNKTYGALGGAVVLSLWMFLSAVAILVGAELNAELEHQTGADSTVGPPRPMGRRDAAMADKLGDARPDAERKTFRDALRATVADLYRKGKRKPRLTEPEP
jgi:membrane protein